MFDLRDVVTYLAQRVGLLHGRVWFGAGNAVNATLTFKQRRNLLRFLNRHGLNRLLVVDNLQPRRQDGAQNRRRPHCWAASG